MKRVDMGLREEGSAVSPDQQNPSPWHSPVPYLFGGLAATLGLIAFALLILACSYRKLSSTGHLEGGNDDGEGNGDLESGHVKYGDASGINKEGPSVFEQKIHVVIMAGEDNPTFLARPVTSS